ncbi:HEPN domain-containing protein [Arthrobacter sp. B0490]|uniref:ApeA N-terminal domain 1-containing protein n=1 Tax=Arthrobacter sp. B0490 TaxID=2058891 RepID=UPI0015E3B954|nr:HEPN domain-containing protein [Arthrobacter sp. B0490]
MTDGVPLSMALEPGLYRVEWSIPGMDGRLQILSGDLTLEADTQPIAEVYGDVPCLWESVEEGIDERKASFPQFVEHRDLRGRLLNGLNVILLDARLQIVDPERAVINARAALIGRQEHQDDEPLISRLEMQFEHLDAVSGVTPIKSVTLPNVSAQLNKGLSFGAETNPGSNLEWTDHTAKVEFRYVTSSTSADGYFFRVAFSPLIVVSFKQAISFDSALSGWLEPMRRLISLATRKQAATTYLAVGLEGDENRSIWGSHQVYGSALTQAPFASRDSVVRKARQSFTFSEDGHGVLALIRRWQELQAEHHPLLETYGSMMFAPIQHPRSTYLLLIQAIEGLHGYEDQDAYAERLHKHKETLKCVLSALKETPLSKDHFKFIKNCISNRPPENLDKRLKAVAAGAPIDFAPKLARTALVQSVIDQPDGPTDWAGALRVIRNDLAHGNRGFDPRELLDVVRLLDGIVRAQFLRVLGCAPEAQKKTQSGER